MAKKSVKKAKKEGGATMRRAAVDRILAGAAGQIEGAAPLAAAQAVGVVFKCSNPQVMVGIKIQGVPGFTFFGQQGLQLPAGTRPMGWKATSAPLGAQFTITVQGGTLDRPISGATSQNSAGLRQLTV